MSGQEAVLSERHSVEEVKRLLSPGKGSGKKGWFGSKGRNHVALTIHVEEGKTKKARER